MKQHQPSMSVNEQIANLKDIGLIINNEEYAKNILNDISYFRLIKAYSLRLKNNGKYDDKVSFEDLVALYMFDYEFRHILFAQIERIEVSLRCRISNYFCEKYGVFGYRDINNFHNQNDQIQILSEIDNEIKRNSKAPFIKNFKYNYDGGDIPFYATAEVLSFGALSKYYKNMYSQDKKAIANTYGLKYKFLQSWIESISFVRNICAHYGRLYNAKFSKMPKLYKEYNSLGICNNNIFSVLICMKHILNIDVQWRGFVDALEDIFLKYPNVDISTMGFVANWNDILK